MSQVIPLLERLGSKDIEISLVSMEKVNFENSKNFQLVQKILNNRGVPCVWITLSPRSIALGRSRSLDRAKKIDRHRSKG